MLLNIKNLHVSIGGKEILKGFNMEVNEGEIHAIMGPNGTGKSTLAEALAHRACEHGMRTYYASAPKLMNKLKGAKAKGTYEADMKKIEKSSLLVLDDLFILGLDAKERAILLDIIEDRHGGNLSFKSAQGEGTTFTFTIPIRK